MVGEPYAGKPDILRRECVAERRRISHIPQHILIQVHRACLQRSGVDRAEAQRVQKA